MMEIRFGIVFVVVTVDMIMVSSVVITMILR